MEKIVYDIFLSQFYTTICIIDDHGSQKSQIGAKGHSEFITDKDRKISWNFDSKIPAKFNKYWKIDNENNIKGVLKYCLDDEIFTIGNINCVEETLIKYETKEYKTTIFYIYDNKHFEVDIKLNGKSNIINVTFTFPSEDEIPKTYQQIRAFRKNYFIYKKFFNKKD